VIVSNMVDYSLTALSNEHLILKLPLEPPLTPDTLISSDLYEGDHLVGIALDGVPIYSALTFSSIDIIQPDSNTGPEGLSVDGCGGSLGPTPHGVRYHYRVMPACILLSDHTDLVLERRRKMITDVEELLDVFDSFYGHHLLGVSRKGFPIYSPFDSRGHLHQHLDSCNGKFVNGSYGYYVRPTFPYIIGCEGPGEYNFAAQGVTSEELTGITGVSYKSCPNGYYSVSTSNGCRACPAGFFASGGGCEHICPRGHYCPPASVEPLRCPAGRFGAAEYLISSECSGLCSSGYFCPSGSTLSNRYPCGAVDRYCPTGSGERLSVSPGYYSTPEDADYYTRSGQAACTPGHYCQHGVRYLCPAGTYGSTSTLEESGCSGVCPVGYFCPIGTVNPVPCPAGSFGDTSGLTVSQCSGLCFPGHWCPAASVSPTQRICASGRVGEGFGLATSECSDLCSGPVQPKASPTSLKDTGVQSNMTAEVAGLPVITGNRPFCAPRWCEEGYFCPPGSTLSTQQPCGSAAVYCATGSSLPSPVDVGYYTVGSLSRPHADQMDGDNTTRIAQVQCELGYWCAEGVRRICPSGVFGSSLGLTSSACSGSCAPGYYCPEGSTKAEEKACGDPSLYCPMGSSLPSKVPKGYFTENGTLTTRSDIEVCPPGYFCDGGVKFICRAGIYGAISGLYTKDCSGLCAAGYYCPEGSVTSTQIPCPAGRFGFTGAVNANCTGLCLAGYYCPSASTSATQFDCGADNLFCPTGSSVPLVVATGYYSTGGTAVTRTGQSSCVGTDLLGTPPAADHRRNICPSTTV